jgi:exonuclease III
MQELNNLIIKLRRDLGTSHNINKFLQEELEEFNTTVRNVRNENGEIICKQEVKTSQESVRDSE